MYILTTYTEDNLGKATIYYANTFVKHESGKKLDAEKEFGIQGYFVNSILVKSRSNTAGVMFKTVFDQANGFNNLYTNYANLKDAKLIGGAGRSFYLKNFDSVKFSQKKLTDVYYSNEEFREKFDEEVEKLYLQYISNTNFLSNDEEDEEDEEEQEMVFDESVGYYTQDGEVYYQYNEEASQYEEVEFE